MPEIPAAVNQMLLNFKDPGHSKFFVFSFCGEKKLFKLAPEVLTSFSAATEGSPMKLDLFYAVKRLNVSVSLVVKHVDVNGTKLPLILF